MAGTLMYTCTQWQGWGAWRVASPCTSHDGARPKFSSRKSEHQQHHARQYTSGYTRTIAHSKYPLQHQVLEYSSGIAHTANTSQSDSNVRQAQPVPRPLAYTRRCSVQITCALSDTSRRLQLPLTQQRPSTRQWHTRQSQPQSFALTLPLTQQLAPSIRPPSEPRPPTTQRKDRHRKTHKERQRGTLARDLRQLRRHPGPGDADQPPVLDEPWNRVCAVCHSGGCGECDCAHARSTIGRRDDQCFDCVA